MQSYTFSTIKSDEDHTFSMIKSDEDYTFSMIKSDEDYILSMIKADSNGCRPLSFLFAAGLAVGGRGPTLVGGKRMKRHVGGMCRLAAYRR